MSVGDALAAAGCRAWRGVLIPAIGGSRYGSRAFMLLAPKIDAAGSQCDTAMLAYRPPSGNDRLFRLHVPC